MKNICYVATLRHFLNIQNITYMTEELKTKIEEMVMTMPAIGKKQGVEIMDALFAEARKLAATPEERAEAGAYLRTLLVERKKKEVMSM